MKKSMKEVAQAIWERHGEDTMDHLLRDDPSLGVSADLGPRRYERVHQVGEQAVREINLPFPVTYAAPAGWKYDDPKQVTNWDALKEGPWF